MKDFEFDFDEAMPGDLKDLLDKLIEMTRKTKSLTVNVSKDVNFDYHFFSGSEIYVKPQSEADPLYSLEMLELVSSRENWTQTPQNRIIGWTLFITPKAYRWHKYYKASRIKKWWMKNQKVFGDVILGISFVLSVLLTVLQILG